MGLESVEFVMRIEDEFGVEFSEAEAAALETVDGMHAAVLRKLRERGDEISASEVFNRLRDIIVDQLGVRPEEVQPRAYFVRDLGVD